MGLDMYLSAVISFSKYREPDKAEEVRKMFPEMFKIGNLDTIEVKFEVGYWRKTNAIHNWFVENCQEGVDNCQKSYVSREDLEKLKQLCEEVLKDEEKASKILPTKSGFFFGSEEYDEYYFDDLRETIEIIERCLKLSEKWDFEYQSSW